jgi:glycosyltransferase involved in cell wall biosynthesis
MHIALVTHRFVRGDGQGRVNLEVAQAALRRGWKLTLLASEVTPELLQHGDVRWVRISVAAWPTELIRNQVFACVSGRWLARHRHEIDLTFVNGFITWARGDVAAAHFVHSAWLASRHRPRARSARGFYQYLYSALNARLEDRAYRAARCVIAVSEQVRQQLLAGGIPERAVDIIPNGVDTREFCPNLSSPRSSLSDDEVTALFVGDLQTARKNLHTVMRALPDCPGVTLAVAGTVGRSPYPELAQRLGVADRVRFLGFRRDLPDLMRAVDFVIFPSLYEPCGLVLFEAMASGIPVLTARTVGGLEVVDPGCVLVLEDPEDVAAMAAAIVKLASSSRLRAEMGAAGRRQALDLDFTRMAERYCDLLARCQGELEDLHGSSRPQSNQKAARQDHCTG